MSEVGTICRKPAGDIYFLSGDDDFGFRWNAQVVIVSKKGSESGLIMARYDDITFTHYWSHTGTEDFRDFLAELDYSYFMKKTTANKGFVFDLDASFQEMKRNLCVARREDDFLTKEKAREVWKDMHRIYKNSAACSTDYFYHDFEESLYVEELLDNEVWELPDMEVPDVHCAFFWNNVWPALLEEFRKEQAAEAEELFYLQDSREVVGNYLSFWRKKANGYTCDLNDAETYTREQVMQRHRNRRTDIPWPKSYLDQHVHRAVDIQLVDRDKALEAAGIELTPEPPKKPKPREHCPACGCFLPKAETASTPYCIKCGTDRRP